VPLTQHLSCTRVSLLDAFTVPSVMLFSRMLFRMRYTPRQLLAVPICLSLTLAPSLAPSQSLSQPQPQPQP